ncbi:hypothetical protein PCE1_003968 [Barthelona sp. PCE]
MKSISNSFLSVATGLASGSMLYVSFTELLSAAVEDFTSFSKKYGSILAYASFFIGIALGWVLELVLPDEQSTFYKKNTHSDKVEMNADMSFVSRVINPADNQFANEIDEQRISDDVIGKEEEFQIVVNDEMNLDEELSQKESLDLEAQDETSRLHKKENMTHTFFTIGVSSFLVLLAHNLPEGFVLMLSGASDHFTTSESVALAISLAIHNVAEGLAIVFPLMAAGSSKWFAFNATVLCGVAEPIGSLLAFFLIDGSSDNHFLIGSLMGIVAGLMTYVVIEQLLPTSRFLDSKRSKISIVIGMFIMALSLAIAGLFE